MIEHKGDVMLLTHEQIVTNHGRCLGLLSAILSIGDMTIETRKTAAELVDEMTAHHKASREAIKGETE